MAQVKYKPEPGVSDETEQFGYEFKGGKAVEVTDEQHLAKFRGNRFFEVSTKQKKAETADDEGLKAVHVAGGRFVIKKGNETVKEGLNKADADAFNAMADDDKAEYVK